MEQKLELYKFNSKFTITFEKKFLGKIIFKI